MKKQKYPIGEVVRIIFLDHASGTFEPILCELTGKLWSVHDDHVVIVTWDIANESQETRHSNMEQYSILRKAIKEFYLYKSCKHIDFK